MWWILAGIAGLLTLAGTIAIIIYDWSHVLAKMYFYAGLALTILFVIMAVLEWKDRVEQELARKEMLRGRRAEE